jgi:hypothetical protein
MAWARCQVRCSSTAPGQITGGWPADDTRAWRGSWARWAMACQPAAVAGSAAASGQLVVINGEGARRIDVEGSTRIERAVFSGWSRVPLFCSDANNRPPAAF